MKGTELPVSTIAVIVIVVLVAVGVIALYSHGYLALGTTNIEIAKNDACYEFVRNKCDRPIASILINKFDANNDKILNPGTAFNTWGDSANCNIGATSQDNLASLCQCYYNANSEELCKKVCNCQAGAAGGGGIPGPCTPLTCADLGYECGTWDDGCGGIVDCGTCPIGETCSDGRCGIKLTIRSETDFGYVPNPPVPNVNIIIDGITGITNSSGYAELFVSPGNNQISVDSMKSGRSFSHFWDQDCDPANIGYYWDTSQNPYSFVMFNRERKMTVFYKIITYITNNAKVHKTFEFDGSTIKGKLLDENDNSINTTYNSRCDSCQDRLTCGSGNWDRKITLEYSTDNGVTWIPINTITATPWPGNGGWSQAWTCAAGANKLRATYIPNDPKDWYYNISSATLTVCGGGSCPDGTCSTGENCPADAGSCTEPAKCKEKTCTNGCNNPPSNFPDHAQDNTGINLCNNVIGCASPPCECISGICVNKIVCPDGTCSTGENCPADAGSCTEPAVCHSRTCINGCNNPPDHIPNGQQDTEGTKKCDNTQGCASPPCQCDGAGNCIVKNKPPVARFTEDKEEALINEIINFDASSSSDPEGDSLTYDWSFGDGNIGAGITTSHRYQNAGTFYVTLYVDDGHGNLVSATSTKTIVASCTCSWRDYQCGNSLGPSPACEFDGSCLEWKLCKCIPAGCGDAFNYCDDHFGTVGSEGDYVCSSTLCGENWGPHPDC